MKQNKTKYNRLEVRLNDKELKALEALIQEHYNSKGIILSKNQAIRFLIMPSIMQAQDWLVWEEGEREELKARGL